MKNTKRTLTKIVLSPWLALITLALILGVRLLDTSFTESVRLRYFDQLITSRPATVPKEVVVVNIDEEALNKWGQWPPSRDVYAGLVKDLYDRGAGLVVLNIMMPEADRSGRDSTLAAALKDYPVVLPSAPSTKTKNQPRNPGTAILNPEWSDQIVQYPGLIANIPTLENAAAGIGTVNTLPEVDGVNRRIPLVVTVDGKIYPGLALETLRVAAGDSTIQVKLAPTGVEKLRVPKFGPITTDNLGRVWIDWSQRPQNWSVTALPPQFDGAIVIVGATASGIANPVPTSIGAVFPHSVQATVLSTVASGTTIVRPDWSDGAELLMLAAAGIVLLVLTRWVYIGIASVVVIVGAIVGGSVWAYHSHLMLLDATLPAIGIIVVALHAYGVKFITEFRQKQMIKKQFGGYISPVMVERLQRNPELIKLGGEKRDLSIVMTDLRGFTTLGESYGDDVEGLTEIMNDYMTAISEPILTNDGCLIKYIGDASLHVHGAPLDDPQHAVNAVKTGLEMIGAVETFNQELDRRGKPRIGMGVGVNTGPTLIGNIGSKARFGYDVLGDSVSTAARLEGQSKPYGVKIVIGPETKELVENIYAVLELDNIAVKGKTVGLQIYTVLGRHDDLMSTMNYVFPTQQHGKMLELYRAKCFDTAISYCGDLKGSFGGMMDDYYTMWIERCEEMKGKNLPENWDGIYRATSK